MSSMWFSENSMSLLEVIEHSIHHMSYMVEIVGTVTILEALTYSLYMGH